MCFLNHSDYEGGLSYKLTHEYEYQTIAKWLWPRGLQEGLITNKMFYYIKSSYIYNMAK